MLAGRGPGPGRLRQIVKNGRHVWQADYRDSAGARRRVVLGSDRRAAEVELARIIRARDVQLLSPATGQDVALSDVCEVYLAHLRTYARPRTAHDAAVVLRRALAEIGARTVRELTRARVVAWRARLVGGGLAHKSANTAVGTLHAALAYALLLGTIEVNPITGLRGLPLGPRHRKRMPRALNEFELARLLTAADRLDAVAKTMPKAPVLRALVGTGARWSELVACRWADLDWERGSLTLRGETTKTQRTRTLPLAPELLEALSEYRFLQARRLGREPVSDEAIFLGPTGRPLRPVDVNTYRDWLYKALDAAGLPRRDSAGRVFHVHALRHTFATRLARAGVAIQTCAALTGHRTVEILLAVYTHVEAEEARAAIEALPRLPRSGSL